MTARRSTINKWHDFKKQVLKKIVAHPLVQKLLNTYARQEYSTALFVLRETLAGFARHKSMGLSASLAFYALFALIPLMLLIFFLLSHLIFSSDYTIVKLAILTGNLVPDFSNTIMTEVYNTTRTKAAWGVLGLLVLLWSVTPLASAMRTSFHTITSCAESPSFFAKKLQDIVSVLGILLLLLLFTAAGFALEKVVRFFAAHFSAYQLNLIGGLLTLILTTLLIALFYLIFLPIRVVLSHLFVGALVTASLWLCMRPAFALFLSIHQHYGAVFGSMKTLFISITWIYLNFAIFLLGSELIVTLRNKDILLLKGLFDGHSIKPRYITALMNRYGHRVFREGDKIVAQGQSSQSMYLIAKGSVAIMQDGELTNTLHSGDYFGEVAMLAEQTMDADAIVTSAHAKIIVINAENIDSMLLEDARFARQLLKNMALKMRLAGS